MERIPALEQLLARALLLDLDAYREMKDRPQPAADGLHLLLALGAALGLAGVLAAILHWATSPDLTAVQEVLARDLRTLPLWRRLDPGGAVMAFLAAHPGWRWPLAAWLRPTPLLVLLRLPATALGLPLAWLAYSLPAHALGRLWGGRGSLEQTLGGTALAAIPLVLLFCPLLPLSGPLWIGPGAWALAGCFLALKAAHGLEGWRAFWAALVPALLVVVLAVLLLASGFLLVWTIGGGLR